MSEDLEGVARIWYQIGRAGPHVSYPRFEAAVVDVLERHIVGRPMEDWDLAIFFRDLANAAVKHGVRLPSDFTMIAKALLNLAGGNQALEVEWQLVKLVVIALVLGRVLTQAIDRGMFTGVALVFAILMSTRAVIELAIKYI